MTVIRTSPAAGRLLAALGGALLAACAPWVPPVPPGPADAAPRIVILSALDAELERLRAATTVRETRVVNGRTLHLGELAGHRVVLLLAGYSMVNAAMTTQAVLDRVPARLVVFSGIAGGVNPGLRVGDVAVPARWGNYQEHVFARETPGGFDPGRLAGAYGHFGMMYPRDARVVDPAGPPDAVTERFWFDADSLALATAGRVAATVALARCTTAGDCLAHEPRVVVGGRGVSGPTFVDNAAYRDFAWRTFGADALDMESAAVAHVAWQNRVPFVVFRSLSDLAGGGAGANQARTFFRLAADNSADVVLAFLRALPPGPRAP